MSGLTTHPVLGTAALCVVPIIHRPRPLRFVWHHVLPQTCGGQTNRENCISVCDNCHYSVHILMWNLANHRPVPDRPNQAQLRFAMTGYQDAVAAGTAVKIPKEA